ncbi:hypothetical protein K440DRAFT_559528, partial [Wilcoxina mikolae CBS 423.85]
KRPKLESTDGVTKSAEKKKHHSNKPFSRIDLDKISYEDEILMRNDYEAVGFAPDHYAARAHQDLIITKGKGFTKEKNKKKRGSYKGGVIDFATRSYKFQD